MSDAGSITVDDGGRMKFTAGSGNVKALRVDPAQKDRIVEAFVALASAKPVAPQQRFRPPSNAAAADTKAGEKKPEK